MCCEEERNEFEVQGETVIWGPGDVEPMDGTAGRMIDGQATDDGHLARESYSKCFISQGTKGAKSPGLPLSVHALRL